MSTDAAISVRGLYLFERTDKSDVTMIGVC
jgi:hypothetical protein